MAKSFMLYTTPADDSYLPSLKQFLHGSQVYFTNRTPLTATETYLEAKKKGVDGVITTNPKLLNLLRNKTGERLLSLDDYAGSIIDFRGMEYLILNPLEQLYSVPYGKFLFERYLSKFTAPEKWFQQTDFVWELANETTIEKFYTLLCSSLYAAVDIETVQEGRRITCVSYTCVNLVAGSWSTNTFVVPLTSEFWWLWIKRLNDTEVPKIFQNGKYDNAYFFRFRAPVKAYYFDTINLFHCWYSELPKRLDFIASFSLRKVEFWKDEGATGNLEDYYRYNARDGWATANSFLSILGELPRWAEFNYLHEFPLAFPCHLAEMTGLKVDVVQMKKLEVTQKAIVDRLGLELERICGPGFNASSPKQVVALLKVLGCSDITSSGEIELRKASFRHPLNKNILDKILDFRKARKLVTTYLVEDKLHKGRILYTLNPHGTDTARLASKESQFSWSKSNTWAGLQIQNIPRERVDIEIKSMFVADEGFLFGEGDYEQAEARDVAYLSGDANLLATVESTRDFHALNAERFFGVSYDKIYDDEKKEPRDKTLRDLSKRVNHGSNYNMGWQVLIDTMGLDKIFQARSMLKLPKHWSARKIAEHLLDVYDKAYPTVKGAYYDSIKYSIATTKMLVSALCWTRYCFSDPGKNKQALNSYVAHPSQNLNAGTLNIAWMRVFKDVALKEQQAFKLCAQIHDSILFQYRRGRTDLVKRVSECMEFPVNVRDCKGIERELRVPVAMKAEAVRWSEIKSWKG